MGDVRDPMFWKRFSVAVKQDEEAQQRPMPVKLQRPELKHSSESWLDRQNHKKARRTCICWVFWLTFFTLIVGGIIVVTWLKTTGVLDGKHKAAAATPTPMAASGDGLDPPQWGKGLSPTPTAGAAP